MATSSEVIRAGDLELRPRERMATARGRVLCLSVRELSLLAALAHRHGIVVSRAELYEAVWGGVLREDDRSVDVYVHKLRCKLEAALPDWRFIHTHVGFGYRFESEPSHGFHKTGTNA